MGVFAQPSSLDPVVAQGGGTGGNHEMGAVYDTLMRIDPATKQFVPQLAESITSNTDGSEFTLKLRANTKFSDGTAYDAAAVMWGLKRHVTFGSAFAGQVSAIKEYTVVDPQTLKLTLTSPWPNFPYVLSNAPGMIPSPTAFRAVCPDETQHPRNCAAFGLKPTGAGPFVVESVKANEATVLKRNTTYWNGAPYLESVRFVFIAGAQGTYDALKTNTLQVGFLREAQVIKTAADEKQFDAYQLVQGFGGIVLLNNGQITCKGGLPAAVCAGKPDGIIDMGKPTGDKRIRQAIAYAVDTKALDERLNAGTGIAGTDFFKGSKFDVGPSTEYSLDKAKALVDAYKKEKNWDGSINVLCQNTPIGQSFSIAISAMLNAAGFKATSDVKPTTEYITGVQTTRNYDVACWGFNVADEAPEAGLSRHVLSVAGGNSGGNAMNLNNSSIDTQINAIKAAKSDADKKAAFEKINTIWKDEVPSVVYANTPEVISFSKKLKGLKFNVATTVMFDKAWLDS